MSTENNLYGKEIDMLTVYGPSFFHGCGNNIESVTDYLKRKHAKRCNCVIGKSYDKIEGLTYAEVKERHETLQNQLGGPEQKDSCFGNGKDCPGAGVCAPAGQRSRMEWCKCGNLINE